MDPYFGVIIIDAKVTRLNVNIDSVEITFYYTKLVLM